MWTEICDATQAQSYAALMRRTSVDLCSQLAADEVIKQIGRPGFHYWLYDDGKGGQIGFAYRYVPGCGHLCTVLQYEQEGLGYDKATAIFRGQLRAVLDADGVKQFKTLGLIKTQPKKIAAIRREFTEILEEIDADTRIELILDRSRER